MHHQFHISDFHIFGHGSPFKQYYDKDVVAKFLENFDPIFESLVSAHSTIHKTKWARLMVREKQLLVAALLEEHTALQ